MSHAIAKPDLPPWAAELDGLIRAVEAGDRGRLPELKAALARVASRADLEAVWPDASAWAARLTVEAVVGKAEERAARRAALAAHLRLRRAELAGPQPSPLEDLLAARVALAELVCAAADASAAEVRGRADGVGAFWRKASALADRRLAAAAVALARCRRLALPRLRLTSAEAIGRRDCPEGGGR